MKINDLPPYYQEMFADSDKQLEYLQQFIAGELFYEKVKRRGYDKDKDIVVVGVNFESISNEQLKSFVEKLSIPYPVLRSEPVRVTALGKVPALPTTYIIDPDGNVVAGEVGLVSRQSLEDYIAGKKAEKVSASRNSSDGDIGPVAMYQ